MKRFLLFLILLTPLSTFASGDFSKDAACKLKDGVYEKDLQVNYPGYTTQVLNFIKSNKRITYIINSWKDTYPISMSVYEYNCTSKKAVLINDLTDHNTYGGYSYGEIDYLDTNSLVIRFKGQNSNYKWHSNGEGIIDRKTRKYREFTFSNYKALMDQYITSFSTPDADPFIISDVKSGKGGKLLVITEWIYPVMTLTFYIDPKTLELTTLDNSQSFFGTQGVEGFISFTDGTKNPVADYAYNSISKEIFYISSQGNRRPIIGAHFPSFGTLPGYIGIITYAKDQNHVYFEDAIIPWADPITFTTVGKTIEKDKNNVYRNNYRIDEADADSIQELDMNYYKDKNNVYYFGTSESGTRIIPGADPKTFRVDSANYNSGYAKDNSGVYKNGKKVGGA